MVSVSDKLGSAGVCTLEQYITRYYDGNRSEFARRRGYPHQNIARMIRQGTIVVDDKLYTPIQTRAKGG